MRKNGDYERACHIWAFCFFPPRGHAEKLFCFAADQNRYRRTTKDTSQKPLLMSARTNNLSQKLCHKILTFLDISKENAM